MSRNRRQWFSRHKNDKKELTNSLVSNTSRFRELYGFFYQSLKFPKVLSSMYVLCLLVYLVHFRECGFPFILEIFPVNQCLLLKWSTISLELNFSSLTISWPLINTQVIYSRPCDELPKSRSVIESTGAAWLQQTALKKCLYLLIFACIWWNIYDGKLAYLGVWSENCKVSSNGVWWADPFQWELLPLS